MYGPGWNGDGTCHLETCPSDPNADPSNCDQCKEGYYHIGLGTWIKDDGFMPLTSELLTSSQCESYAISNSKTFAPVSEGQVSESGSGVNPRGCFTQGGNIIYFNSVNTAGVCGNDHNSDCILKADTNSCGNVCPLDAYADPATLCQTCKDDYYYVGLPVEIQSDGNLPSDPLTQSECQSYAISINERFTTTDDSLFH